jgi:hypothetical protein
MESSEMHDTLRTAAVIMEEAKQFGVEAEVMMWAVIFMKDNPSLTVEQAIVLGSNEWIK